MKKEKTAPPAKTKKGTAKKAPAETTPPAEGADGEMKNDGAMPQQPKTAKGKKAAIAKGNAGKKADAKDAPKADSKAAVAAMTLPMPKLRMVMFSAVADCIGLSRPMTAT